MLLNSAASAGTGVASSTCNFTIPATQPGSTLVLTIASDSFGVSSIACGSGLFTSVEPAPNAHNFGLICMMQNVTGGTTSGTVTFGGATNSGVQALEFSGLLGSPAGAVTNASGSSTAPQSGPLTPLNTANVVICIAITNVAIGSGPSGGATGLTALNWVGTRQLVTGYVIENTNPATTIGWTISSAFWDSAIAEFKADPLYASKVVQIPNARVGPNAMRHNVRNPIKGHSSPDQTPAPPQVVIVG